MLALRVQSLPSHRGVFERTVMKNRFLSLKALGVSTAAALAGAAHAALPTGAEAAITGVGTDVVTAVGLVIIAGISIYAAKKLGSKMGWL